MEENPENVTPVDADDSLSFVESELEALLSIYINEIEVKQGDDQKSTCVSIDLHPATADKPEEQYVKMTLKFTLSEEYPHTMPDISIRNPRGLSDEKITSTYQDLISIAEKRIGNSMLFEIIEAAKEHLTTGNRPCGECAICLYGFSDSDVFIKTDCYHYFHSHCLARYAKNVVAAEVKEEDPKTDEASKELLCPMCRVPIQFPGVDEPYPPPSTGDDECLISEQILEMQKKMSDLFQKQLEKGGIIDIEAEKNKYLLEISNVPTLLNAAEKSDPVSEENEPSVKTDENAGSNSQSPKKDKSQDPKEAKSGATRPDEKFRQNKRLNKRGNHNSHSNFPRGNRKQKAHYDSYDEDYDESAKETRVDDEKDVPQSTDASSATYPRSKPFVGKGQRPGGYSKPRRENYEGFSRGNYSRYPRKNMRGYNSSQRHHSDRNDPDTERFDSGKDVSPQSDSSCANKEVPDSSLEETRESGNAPDSYKRHGDFDRRNKNRGRFPRNGPRGWGGNYSGNSSRRGNYRNRQEDNYDNHVENFSNSYSNDLERDSPHDGTEVPSFCEEDSQFQRNANGRSYRNNPRRQSRGGSQRDTGHEASQSGEGDNSHVGNPADDDATSHKKQEASSNQEGRPEPRRNVESSYGRNRPDSFESRNERRFNGRKSNYSHQPVRNQFQGRREDFDENGRQHQRYDNYSQNSAPRRNHQRDGYGNNINNDRRGYQHGGRGRNNTHYQNRNAGYEGSQRRHQENASFQNNRNAYRPRKTEDSTVSYQNGKLAESGVPGAQSSEVSGDVVKSFDPSSVKAFVPKEDSSMSFGSDPELLSQKVACPPPGFSNPLKKVVYGLEAAKPPPGFPRR